MLQPGDDPGRARLFLQQRVYTAERSSTLASRRRLRPEACWECSREPFLPLPRVIDRDRAHSIGDFWGFYWTWVASTKFPAVQGAGGCLLYVAATMSPIAQRDLDSVTETGNPPHK